jgi:type IV secretion system protein VirD4
VLASPLIAGTQHMRTVARMTTTETSLSVLRVMFKMVRQHLPTRIDDSFNQYIAPLSPTRVTAPYSTSTWRVAVEQRPNLVVH